MAASPCMKNRSLKAGGRLNRWSLKAGFTVRSYEDDQPLCTLGMCPENEWEVSRLGLRSGSMCKKRTQCATSCCGQGVGKVLAQVFTRKKF